MKRIVILSRSAKKSLLKLDAKYKSAIIECIDDLSVWPEIKANRDIVKLKGFENTYRLREGIYRIIFTEIKNTLVIEVLRIEKRKDAYK